jgi:hypothetical protein
MACIAQYVTDVKQMHQTTPNKKQSFAHIEIHQTSEYWYDTSVKKWH